MRSYRRRLDCISMCHVSVCAEISCVADVTPAMGGVEYQGQHEITHDRDNGDDVTQSGLAAARRRNRTWHLI